jgi:ornithine cyclodeaminase/alanine dehydrogenase-like protein (mu-crystallin family)
MTPFLYVSPQVVSELLDDQDVVRLAEMSLRAQAAGQVSWSTPPVVGLPSDRASVPFRSKLCALETVGVVGCRVMGNIGARATQYPQSGMVLLGDASTGQFLALIDEHRTYAVRTGAAAAIALRYLAAPGTDVVGLVGAGQIGRGVARALRAALPLRRLLVHDARPAAVASLREELGSNAEVELCPLETAQAVLEQANAVVLATTAKQPFVRAAWVRPGSTIYSLGEHQELDTAAYLDTDKFIVDDWEHVSLKSDLRAMLATGTFQPERVHASLAQVVVGARSGREAPSERILIRSAGLAIMDVAVAHWVYQQALATGRGQALGT